ncbi:hypothetical protein Tco_1272140 [Tanacetum coccineum]
MKVLSEFGVASVEYRQSVAAPVRLSFTAGWLSGLSLGRTEDEIEKFIAQNSATTVGTETSSKGTDAGDAATNS